MKAAWLWPLAAAVVVVVVVVALVSRPPPPRRETLPGQTVPPSTLSLAAKRLPHKQFEDIESQMAMWGKLVDAELRQSQQARIKLMRARTELILKTTHTTQAYAAAVLTDPSASHATKDAARKVLVLRQAAVRADEQADNAGTFKEARAALRAAEAAKWDLLEASVDMMTGNDAVKDVPHVPTTRPLPDCPSNDKWDPTRGTAKQRAVMKYLRDKAMEFVAHMYTTRPELKSTQNVVYYWNRRIIALSKFQDATSGTNGSFNYETGCLGVAMDSFSSLPRMMTRVIHELTHATMGPGHGHGKEFYAAFRNNLRIATEELGWTLETTCRETCFGAGFEDGYDPNLACPKCVWQEDPVWCNATTKLCEPKTKDQPTHVLPVLDFLGIKSGTDV